MLSRLNFIPGLISRITLAAIFIEAGWGKFHNLEGVTGYFMSLGIPAAHLQAPMVAGLEFVCGLLLLAGLLTRWASLPLIVIMLVAIWTTQLDNIKSLGELFSDSHYLYIALLVWLVFYGAGACSVDFLIKKSRQKS